MRKYISIREIVVSQQDDRIILIVRNNEGQIIGLNYSQGWEDLTNFENNFYEPDTRLTNKYLALCDNKLFSSMSELDKINEILWLLISIDHAN